MSVLIAPEQSFEVWLDNAVEDPEMLRMVTPRLTKYIPHEPTITQSMALVAHRFVADPSAPVEIFYGGAAGGGKSDWLLMAGLQYVDQPEYAGIIFRRTFAQLSKPGALISRSKQWLMNTDAQWSEDRKEWNFPSGAKLAFGYLENADDVEVYQSAEFQFVGFDELTHFEQSQYRYLFSRLRRREGSEIPLRQCGASNPGRRGHAWVRDELVEGSAPNRVFIPAKVDDNPHLDKPAYLASLSHLSPTLQMQLREGVWDAFEGMAYRLIDGVHIVPRMSVPSWWDRFEAMDYGTTAPTAWGCFAIDNDQNVLAHGLYYSPGYPSDHATAIHNKRQGWWGDEPALTFGPADIKTKWGKRIGGKELSAETEFADHGITFAMAQMDRRAGYLRIAEALKLDPSHPFPDWHPRQGELGAPHLFILDTEEMEPLRKTLRDAPLEDPDSPLSKLPGEAVDGEWESKHGHAHAMLRYALTSRPAPSTEPVRPPEDPRARILWEHERRMDGTSGKTYEWS